MSTHRAVVCRALGLGAGLALERVDSKALMPGQVRIGVEAAGVNFPDMLMVQGLYQLKPPLPFVPGMEAAGRVTEISAGSRFAVGQAVFVMPRTGAFADEIVVAEGLVRPLPEGMSMEEGATFGVAALTAFHALGARGEVRPGQVVLVLGASGGVGAATVQFAKAMGATVIAAASTAEKLAFARAAGADHVVDYQANVLEAEVARITAGKGCDLIIDPVGWDPVGLCRAVAFGGKILIAGFAGGTLPAYPANRLLLKGASLIGVRAGEAGRNDPAARFTEWAALLALAEKSDLRPRVTRRFALADFKQALEALAGRQAIGRMVLTCGS